MACLSRDRRALITDELVTEPRELGVSPPPEVAPWFALPLVLQSVGVTDIVDEGCWPLLPREVDREVSVPSDDGLDESLDEPAAEDRGAELDRAREAPSLPASSSESADAFGELLRNVG